MSRFLSFLRSLSFHPRALHGASDFELRTSDFPVERKVRGFSLIEVNIAILVIAGGLLSLFALFPAGLRMSSSALSDTCQALFADDFFAYFDDGVMTITDRADWENVETFWKAARVGLRNGFGNKAKLNDDDWKGDSEVCKDWGTSKDPLTSDDFKKGNVNALNAPLFLRFRHGVVEGYFTDNSASDKLDAEFLVRISSDYNPTDGLIWRVSLIVSDDGTGGWFYDNSVYHRDFRYAELP